MNAAEVHAVLAGGVSDPRRLVRWAADPQALRALGVEPASLDLPALRGFAGLALKVRHNGLRDAFPHTFRLLHVAGLEIEVFADYALALADASAGLAASDEARAGQLIDFIGRWHDPGRAEHALLWDLVRHEQALRQLQRPAEVDPAAAASAPPSAASVPRVRGTLRLLEMQHDPRAIVDALRRREPDLAGVAPAPMSLGYWRAPDDAAVHLVELDAFGFAALQAADGRRSVAELSALLGLGRRPPARVRHLLRQLQAAGLLVFTRRRRSATA